jgi:membrane protein implicated in regulation of membrane protease activity
MLNSQGDTGQQVTLIVGLVLTILLGVLIPAFFIVWFGFIKTKAEQMLGSEEEII